MGDYFCEMAEAEHWVSWEYNEENIEEKHYITFDHLQNVTYKFTRTFIYPIDYSFASLVPYNEYNPKKFSFSKLNILKKDSISSCGDKFSRIKIENTKGKFLELSIYDFENNIIKLLSELNNSASFIDFLLCSHLRCAVDYLEVIKTDIRKERNSYVKITYKRICEYIGNMINQNSHFLPYQVKNNQDSDVIILIKQFDKLKDEISKFM